jgi:hypothetical protein
MTGGAKLRARPLARETKVQLPTRPASDSFAWIRHTGEHKGAAIEKRGRGHLFLGSPFPQRRKAERLRRLVTHDWRVEIVKKSLGILDLASCLALSACNPSGGIGNMSSGETIGTGAGAAGGG